MLQPLYLYTFQWACNSGNSYLLNKWRVQCWDGCCMKKGWPTWRALSKPFFHWIQRWDSAFHCLFYLIRILEKVRNEEKFFNQVPSCWKHWTFMQSQILHRGREITKDVISKHVMLFSSTTDDHEPCVDLMPKTCSHFWTFMGDIFGSK